MEVVTRAISTREIVDDKSEGGVHRRSQKRFRRG